MSVSELTGTVQTGIYHIVASFIELWLYTNVHPYTIALIYWRQSRQDLHVGVHTYVCIMQSSLILHAHSLFPPQYWV